MNAREYLEILFDKVSRIEIIGQNRKEFNLIDGINAMVDFIINMSSTGNKVMFIGNGGSAAIAAHGGIDFWKNGGIKAMCFNDGPSLTCIGNDYGYEFVFEKPISLFAEKGDILVAISSSGKSQNILNGAKAAREKGCHVITLSGFKPSNPLRELGDYNIYVESDSYGIVELSHQIVLHMILDMIMDKKQDDAR